jgi:hypothetical protein
MSLNYIMIMVLLACISYYTASYGLWTWKKKNKLGALMIFLISLMNMALPVYALLFRD